MFLNWIDWLIIASLLSVITAMAVYTRRYTRSVADFLAANRTAGRYLLCISDGMAGLGAISIVMLFEMYYEAGFPVAWWDMMRLVIIPTILCLSGWVIYRFRQTRALTLAQFFEMRYSKNFRVFCGILIWFSGIINFGIFPAVGARFFMSIMGIQETTLVYMLFMFVLLAFSLFFTFMGGQIAVMVTDFIQGVFCNVMFIVIVFVAIFIFKWDDVIQTLVSSGSEASMIHPFNVGKAENYNLWFYLILSFTAAYGFLSWQGAQGYNAAALNAHEARMGKSLGVWRLFAQNLFVLILPICAFTFMNHPNFADKAIEANETLASISDDTIRKQVSATVALRYFLPHGVLGGLCAVMLGAFISTHDTYLHSWGSVFIQDVILPFKKKTLSQEEHIRWLKRSIFGVAVFIFLFSLFFKQSEAIVMFFQITGAIFVGGAGSVIIGGLYWSRGTTQGAWAGMITGSVLAVGGIVLNQIHQYAPFSNKLLVKIASVNGTYMSFWSAVAAIAAYISFSLLSGGKKFNIDKLLHRGKYAIEGDHAKASSKKVGKFGRMVGINEDFSFFDKIVYLGMLAWTLGLIVLFLALTVVNFIHPMSEQFWIDFWRWYIIVSLVLGTFSTIWFAIGGFIDLKKMFSRLASRKVDEIDDGRVVDDYSEGGQ